MGFLNLDKLQRVQNTAVRLVTRSKKHEHITPVLRNLCALASDSQAYKF